MTEIPLDNPRSDRIKSVAALRTRSGRRRSGRALVEGPQAVREALRFRASEVVDIYLSDEAESRDPELAALAREVTTWVHPMTEDVARAISPDCQGIAAVVDGSAFVTDGSGFWDGLLRGGHTTRASAETSAVDALRPFLVCLPEGRDPGNVGTIIRSADAMGAAGVVLGRGTVDPANPKVIRSSAGSVFHLPLVRASLEDVRSHLADAGWLILGTTGQDADITLDELVRGRLVDGAEGNALAQPHVWVFGNEARGLSREDLSVCDLRVAIPITGEAESLNAAAAAAVCVYASHLSALS